LKRFKKLLIFSLIEQYSIIITDPDAIETDKICPPHATRDFLWGSLEVGFL